MQEQRKQHPPSAQQRTPAQPTASVSATETSKKDATFLATRAVRRANRS